MCMYCPCVVLYVAYGCLFSDLFYVTESEMISFDTRTRSLARSRATTVVEEEMDCNTRIVQEGEGMSSVYVLVVT